MQDAVKRAADGGQTPVPGTAITECDRLGEPGGRRVRAERCRFGSHFGWVIRSGTSGPYKPDLYGIRVMSSSIASYPGWSLRRPLNGTVVPPGSIAQIVGSERRPAMLKPPRARAPRRSMRACCRGPPLLRSHAQVGLAPEGGLRDPSRHAALSELEFVACASQGGSLHGCSTACRYRWPAAGAASALIRAAMAGWLRSWCRYRARSGPMLPTGMPSVALIWA